MADDGYDNAVAPDLEFKFLLEGVPDPLFIVVFPPIVFFCFVPYIVYPYKLSEFSFILFNGGLLILLDFDYEEGSI